MFDYIRDPAKIYAKSFATIRAEADLDSLPVDIQPVAERLIHACGMVDVLDSLVYSEDAVNLGRKALEKNAPVLVDVEMVRHGIIESRLPAGNKVICTLNEDAVPGLAEKIGNTRSAAAIELWREKLDDAVIAIGNAPTALFRLLEILQESDVRPALIIGMPVGFVGAAESKDALIEQAKKLGSLPFITVSGRLGGSAMAAATVNALARPNNNGGNK